MSFDIYRDWIVLEGRHWWTGGPRWARIVPSHVAVAPSAWPNAFDGLYPASILDRDGPSLFDVKPMSIGDGLRLDTPQLWVGPLATDIDPASMRTTRYGCVATLLPAVHGFCLVDRALHLDKGIA